MFSLITDTSRITKLQDKFKKYPPIAIKAGLGAMSEEMNSSSFLMGMYPVSKSGQKFIWSSEKQRKFVMANIGLPSSRTFDLAMNGTFTIDEKNFWIEYSNLLPWWIYVLHPSYMIIGHKMRGWKPVNEIVKKQSASLVKLFKPAAVKAWDEMESFMYGGGGGL